MICLVFYSFISLVYAFFLCLAFGWGVDLDPVVQAYIHIPMFQLRVLISSFMHVCALFALFHAFCFRSMLVCLGLGSLPCSCLFSLCGFVICWSLGFTCLFGCIHPFGGLFGCGYVLHLHDVWACLLLAFFLFCLALHFSCQPFGLPYNMLTLPLYVITCSLCFLCDILFGLLCLFASLHVCLYVHANVFVCLFVSSSLVLTCGFVQVHTRLCTQNPESLQEFCLMAHVSSTLQYNGTLDTKSKPTFVLLGHPLLLDNMFA